MKTLVTVLVTSLSVFALATAWVDYVQPRLQPTRVAVESDETLESEPRPVPRRRVRRSPEPDRFEEALEPERPIEPVPALASRPVPVVVQVPPAPPSPVSPDTQQLLNQKLDEVRQQESNLAARQEALRMIYDDIRSELAAVDEIRKQTSEDLEQAERRIAKLSERRASPVPNTARALLERPATDRFEMRSNALIIRRLAQDGKHETAVSLLKKMKSRDVATILEVLAEMDSRLADRLTESILDSADTVRR